MVCVVIPPVWMLRPTARPPRPGPDPDARATTPPGARPETSAPTRNRTPGPPTRRSQDQKPAPPPTRSQDQKPGRQSAVTARTGPGPIARTLEHGLAARSREALERPSGSALDQLPRPDRAPTAACGATLVPAPDRPRTAPGPHALPSGRPTPAATRPARHPRPAAPHQQPPARPGTGNHQVITPATTGPGPQPKSPRRPGRPARPVPADPGGARGGPRPRHGGRFY
jgi:hypothetical protein